ncbi:Proline-rich family protein [Hirschfeldia incana]|nr:Proline-rich family protein [Hirschfeldia incana]
MSTPDPNSSSSASVTATTPSLVTASETPSTNTVRTTPSQPPPPSLPYRAIAPIQQQTHHNNLQSPSIPNHRRPNSPHHHHQDPSTVLYPFAPPPPGRGGFAVRPVRMSSPLVVSAAPPPSSVTAAGNNQSGGYHLRPGLAYNHRQLGASEMETMMQFMRARGNPSQIHHQISHPGSVGPMRGVPHFLQPRVAPPPTSILDTGRNKNARRRDALVLVRGRKVRITEDASLYSLSRSWLRNGAHEGIQSQRSDAMKPLPKPLPVVDVMEAAVPNDPADKPTDEDKEDEESVKELTEKDLLQGHIERAKKVRARLREERSRKIARYKGRLALLLPQSGEQCTKND